MFDVNESSDLNLFESDIRSLIKETNKDINNKFKLGKRLRVLLLKIEDKKQDKKGQQFLSNYK